VASLTLLIIKLNENERDLGAWKWFLAVVAVVPLRHDGQHGEISDVQIARPALDQHVPEGHSRRVVPWHHSRVPRKSSINLLPAFFTLYLIYGFIRPAISRRVRYEIEEEDDELEEAPPQK